METGCGASRRRVEGGVLIEELRAELSWRSQRVVRKSKKQEVGVKGGAFRVRWAGLGGAGLSSKGPNGS